MKPSSNFVVRLALVRPVTVWMIFASILVLGAVAFSNIALELLPKGISIPMMVVQVPYRNATAQDVEDKITRPIEEALSTMPQVKGMFATSSSHLSRVNLQFDPGANMDKAYLDLRDRITRVRPDLPKDVEDVKIQKFSTESFPVSAYGIQWPEGQIQPKERIKRILVPRIERIRGVGLVAMVGGDDKQIRIEVDRERSEAAMLNILELARSMGRSHFNLASGHVRQATGKALLRSVAEFEHPAELEQIIVSPKGLRLKDVAKVRYEAPEKEKYVRYRGKELLSLLIYKESGANTTQIARDLEEIFEQAKQDPQLSGFIYENFYSEAHQIELGLSQVFDSGIQGGLLALVVLGVFLRRFRLTLVIALSIPLSMFMALPFMYFSGQTINMFSLLGLMICIGLVVDNAVVIAENIARYRGQGMGRYLAALQGASEVALPITLATATTMVVFLPAALMSAGTVQVLMVQMVTPICVSLLASLFIALLLMPMASVSLLQDGLVESMAARPSCARVARIYEYVRVRLETFYDRTVTVLCARYIQLLRTSLSRRADVAMIALLAMLSLVIPFHPEHGVKQSLSEDLGKRQIQFSYTLPSDVSLEQADEFFRSLEFWFSEHRHEYGIKGEYLQISREFTQLSVYLGTPKPDSPPRNEIAKRLLEDMPCPPGWEKRGRSGSTDASRDSAFRVYVFGETHEEVQETRDVLLNELLAAPGVMGKLDKQRDTTRRNELALHVDSALSQRLGVAPTIVGTSIAYAIRGSKLPSFRGQTGEIDVWMRYEKEDREQLRDLMRFVVPSRYGERISISSLTKSEIQKAQSILTRKDGRVTGAIELELDPKNRELTKARLTKQVEAFQPPAGMRVSADNSGDELDDQEVTMLFGMALGATLIFLIMGFLFESFVLPLSVLPAIPLSLVGVGWTLYLAGANIDPLVVIAMMLLMGVVVNNAIVLIDFVNTARATGLSRTEAMVKAGQQRFRPILMTSLTTIGGMIPLAFSSGPSEGIAYGGFGKTLVGGLVSSTLLTLFIVPWAYTLLDDLRERVMGWVRRNAPPVG